MRCTGGTKRVSWINVRTAGGGRDTCRRAYECVATFDGCGCVSLPACCGLRYNSLTTEPALIGCRPQRHVRGSVTQLVGFVSCHHPLAGVRLRGLQYCCTSKPAIQELPRQWRMTSCCNHSTQKSDELHSGWCMMTVWECSTVRERESRMASPLRRVDVISVVRWLADRNAGIRQRHTQVLHSQLTRLPTRTPQQTVSEGAGQRG